MAGLLHDTVEDTGTTAAGLLSAGVPAAVVGLVLRVSNRPGVPYEEMLREISGDYAACLLKISDNAHNSVPERAALLPEAQRDRLAAKYSHARALLWPAVAAEDVASILEIVNPSLLAVLGASR
ncbi:HD domain-containing protein [Streptacidiphilus sp. PAMC 29251]